MNWNDDNQALEAAVWAVAEGGASDEQVALLDAQPGVSARVVDALLADTQARLESVQGLKGPERAQVIADFAEELEGLRRVYARFHGSSDPLPSAVPVEEEQGLRLQASWSDGEVVVWAAGANEPAADNDELADLLEALDAPAPGWRAHRGVPLPEGERADAVSIPVGDSLGWLVAIGGEREQSEDVGASVRWLGHLAVAAVRQVARGAVVPTLQSTRRDRSVEMAVRWHAALLDNATIDRFATTMPGAVRVMAPPSVTSRALVIELFGAVVHAVVSQAAAMLEMPAPPPTVRTTADVAESVITRLDGSSFIAPTGAASDVADRLQRWSRSVTHPGRPRLVVQLDPPDRGDAWFLSVLGPGPNRALLDVEVALRSRCRRRSRHNRSRRSWRASSGCCRCSSVPARCAAGRCT